MNAFDLNDRIRLLPLLCRAALPTIPTIVLCERARAFYRLGCEHRGLLAQLPDFDFPQFDAMLSIALELETHEAELDEGLLSLGPVVARLCDEAVSLRARFVRAARYFLRRHPEALKQVAALTHERSIEALTLDLNRISELSTHYEVSLSRAAELPANLTATARRLACALCLNKEGSAIPVAQIQEQRNAIFWLLFSAVNELESALSYLDPDGYGADMGMIFEARRANPSLLLNHGAEKSPLARNASPQRMVSERSQLH